MLEQILTELVGAIREQTKVMNENRILLERISGQRGGATVAEKDTHTSEIVAGAKAAADQEKAATTRRGRKTAGVAEPDPDAVSMEVPDGPTGELGPAESSTIAITRADLTTLALSLAKQDTANKAIIMETLGKHGSKTITALADEHIGAVFTILNNHAAKQAREG